MGVDDGRPALALAHISAQRERLSEGKKRVGREAVGDHGVPEDQNVDPGITVAGFAVARHIERCLRRGPRLNRSEEHTSELQSLMRISYAVFCLKQKTNNNN